jgi:NIMA (never in mitosis gene a)-related kinase
MDATQLALLERVHTSAGCTVFRAKLRRTGRIVAVKQRAYSELGRWSNIHHERDVLARLGPHCHIVEALGAYEQPKGCTHLVLEWADAGDVSSFVRSRARGSPRDATVPRLIPEAAIWRWGAQLFSALSALAAAGVIHRDVKASNVLLCSTRRALDSAGGLPADGPDPRAPPIEEADFNSSSSSSSSLGLDDDDAFRLHLRLADFGVSRVLAREGDMARTLYGTPLYLSPEMLAGQGLGVGVRGGGALAGGVEGIDADAAAGAYSFGVDVWAAGVMMYELAALRLPFNGGSMAALAVSIRRGSYAPIPPVYSAELRGFIARCLSLRPAARPTAAQALDTCRAVLQACVDRARAASTGAGGAVLLRTQAARGEAAPAIALSESASASAGRSALAASMRSKGEARGGTDMSAGLLSAAAPCKAATVRVRVGRRHHTAAAPTPSGLALSGATSPTETPGGIARTAPGWLCESLPPRSLAADVVSAPAARDSSCLASSAATPPRQAPALPPSAPQSSLARAARSVESVAFEGTRDSSGCRSNGCAAALPRNAAPRGEAARALRSCGPERHPAGSATRSQHPWQHGSSRELGDAGHRSRDPGCSQREVHRSPDPGCPQL